MGKNVFIRFLPIGIIRKTNHLNTFSTSGHIWLEDRSLTHSEKGLQITNFSILTYKNCISFIVRAKCFICLIFALHFYTFLSAVEFRIQFISINLSNIFPSSTVIQMNEIIHKKLFNKRSINKQTGNILILIRRTIIWQICHCNVVVKKKN